MFVFIDVAIPFGFEPITTHHGRLEIRAARIDKKCRVAIHLSHEVLIHSVDPGGNGIGLGRDDFHPLGLDNIHRRAFVGLCPLRTRWVDNDKHRTAGEALIQQRLEHGAYEPLHPHIETHALVEYQRTTTGVLLPDHSRRGKAQVHTNDDGPQPVGDIPQALSPHVVVGAEVFVDGHPRVRQPILAVDVDADVLITASLGVVVPLWQVLDVLGVRTAPRRLLEHLPTVVVGGDAILDVESLHHVVPPRIHRWRVGVPPHTMPCGTTILAGGIPPNPLGHGVHDVGVDVAAFVEPRESHFQRVQVRHIVSVIQRPEHDLTLHVPHFEEVGLDRLHELPTLAGREPVEESLDGRVLQLADSFADDCTAGFADTLGIRSLSGSTGDNLEATGRGLGRTNRTHENTHLGIRLHEPLAGRVGGKVDLKRHFQSLLLSAHLGDYSRD